MKSKLIKMYDYKQTVFPNEEYIDEKEIDKAVDEEISHVLAKYKKTVSADCVETGDTVTVAVTGGGGKPKYNKDRLMLTVGKNMYSKDIEEALVGKASGAELDVQTGEGEVHIKINAVTRRIAPEFTDEIAEDAAGELDGEHPDISTAAQYRDWLYKVKTKELGDDIWVKYTDDLMTEIIEKSEWQMDADEIEQIYTDYFADMQKELDEMHPGMTFQTMPPETYHLYYDDISNFDELSVWLHTALEQQLQLYLIYCAMKGVPDTAEDVNDAKGDSWGLLVDYVADKIEIKVRK